MTARSSEGVTPDTLARMIQEREEDIAALQAELDVLRGLEAPKPAARANGAPKLNRVGPTRTQMLAKLVRDAGRTGLTRQEAISEMAKLCDSPPASVAQMLTNLRISGLIAPHEDGHWRAKR